MDYNKINGFNVDGNGNIILHDINGSNITINHNDVNGFQQILKQVNDEQLNKIKLLLTKHNNPNIIFLELVEIYFDKAEIRNKKKSINKKIEDLQKKAQSIIEPKPEIGTEDIDENSFEEVDFDDLISAIKNDNCILFIGPELSVDDDGNSLHEKYYNEISDNRMLYDDEDSFFMPGSEPRLINKTKDFYNETFPKKNIIGNSILEKLALVPFNLIVSYCPDDSLSRIFTKNNITHKFIVYTGESITVDLPQNKEPIIYNALGCATKNGKYIYTHAQFSNRLNKDAKMRIPMELDAKIKQTTNHIFIGFSFEKWYYRLMMFELNLMKDTKPYAFDTSSLRSINKVFLNKQFGLNFINADYLQFAKLLARKINDADLSNPLYIQFTDSILDELEGLKRKTVDRHKLEELFDINKKVDEIEIKIIEKLKDARNKK